MRLDELRVYALSMEMGEKVWNIVAGWNYFAKDTVGKQLVRAVDSVAANLSEGFGGIIPEARYMKPERGLQRQITGV